MKDNKEQTCYYELRKQGEDYLYKKQYSEAIAKFTEELEILNKSKEPDLLRIAECHEYFGEAYKGKADYENSIASFEESLKKYEELCSKVIENYHESIARISNQLGDVFIHAKNYDEAKKAYNDSIEHWGKTHSYLADEYKLPKVAINHNNLANIFVFQQDFKSAEDNYLKALECFHKAYGEDAKDMKIAMCYMNLGISASTNKKTEKSDEYLNKATNILKVLYNMFPDDYSDITITSYKKIITTYEANNNLEKAQEYKAKILNIENKLKFGEHTDNDDEKELIKELASLSIEDKSSDETGLSGQEPNTEGA